MSDIRSGGKFRGVCSKVVEVGLRKKTLRKGLADFTAVPIDDSDGQFIGISVGLPHCALMSVIAYQALIYDTHKTPSKREDITT